MKNKKNIIAIIFGVILFIVSLIFIGLFKTLLVFVLLSIMSIIIYILSGNKIDLKNFFKAKKRHKTSYVESDKTLKTSRKTEKSENTLDTKKTKTKIKKRKLILNIFLIIVSVFATIGVIGTIVLFTYIVKTSPSFDINKFYAAESTVMYDKGLEEMYKLSVDQDGKREMIKYDDLPQVLIDAIVATEDSRFFQHSGVDILRFLKASFLQVLGNDDAGGASTLSMQLIKNKITSKDKSVIRKFKDVYLAVFKLERQYTKEEILELYLNIHSLGANSAGVEAASQTYFGKSAKDINLSEAALLVGLFQLPSKNNPYVNPKGATARRSIVLSLMERHGYITEEERKNAELIDVESMLHGNYNKEQNPYQGFVDMVFKEVLEKTGKDPYLTPMKIYTTMDRTKQDYINEVVNNKFKFPNDVVQIGAALIDVKDGSIAAIGNGRNRTGEKQFNFATMINTQPGSTAKPIFDYGPGMEYNNFSTYTMFKDEPYKYSNGKEINNFDNKFIGDITLKEALGYSRNIPALKAFQMVNNKKILDFALSLGMTPEISNGMIHEAHSIGGYNGTNPVQLAGAYNAFASGGYFYKPYSVSKIELRDTNEIIEFPVTKNKVMSDSTAFMINYSLVWSVNEGPNSALKLSNTEVASKTGTSNFDAETKSKYRMSSDAVNDLWTVGYTSDYVMSLWYGYDKADSKYYNRMSDRSYALNLFKMIEEGVFNKGSKFNIPSSVVLSDVEKGSDPAMLPSANTPSDMIVREYFKVGTEPTEVSLKYQAIPNPTGLEASLTGNTVNLKWNFDFPTYDRDKYGDIEYRIYLNINGNLTLLNKTSNKSYSYVVPSDYTENTITFVVKSSFTKLNSESGGSSTSLTLKKEVEPVITVNLSSSSLINVALNEPYVEPTKPIIVLEDMVDVTNNAIVSTVVKDSLGNVVNINNLDTSIVTSYKVTYTIKYKTITDTLTKTINIQ